MIYYSIGAIVVIETDEGLVGYGEGSPSILITGETLKGTIECLELFSDQLIGVNPLDLEKIHHIMDSIAAKAPSAKVAIDIACYDLLGKKANLPLYQLFGGYSSVVAMDITIGIDLPQIMAENAQKAVENGFDTLKVKVGTDKITDLSRISAIRQAVGRSHQITIRCQSSLAS